MTYLLRGSMEVPHLMSTRLMECWLATLKASSATMPHALQQTKPARMRVICRSASSTPHFLLARVQLLTFFSNLSFPHTPCSFSQYVSCRLCWQSCWNFMYHNAKHSRVDAGAVGISEKAEGDWYKRRYDHHAQACVVCWRGGRKKQMKNQWKGYFLFCAVHILQSESHFSVFKIKWRVARGYVPYSLHSLVCPGEPGSTSHVFFSSPWYYQFGYRM